MRCKSTRLQEERDMSVSLYYIAKRDTHLSKQEKSICNTIIDTYISKYSLGEMYEPFCAYDNSSPTEENVIFEGATKLPIDEGEEHFVEVLDYWAECLQEIVILLKGAEWYIHIDDTDITEQFDFPR